MAATSGHSKDNMTEDLSILFDDFGVLCGTVKVLLEEPDEGLGLGFDGVRASGPRIIYPTGSLALTAGQVVTVGGQSFKVRTEPRKIDDGKLTEASLL